MGKRKDRNAELDAFFYNSHQGIRQYSGDISTMRRVRERQLRAICAYLRTARSTHAAYPIYCRRTYPKTGMQDATACAKCPDRTHTI